MKNEKEGKRTHTHITFKIQLWKQAHYIHLNCVTVFQIHRILLNAKCNNRKQIESNERNKREKKHFRVFLYLLFLFAFIGNGMTKA